MQVLLRSLPVSEEVWDQGAATNSLPGQLQGQSEDGKSDIRARQPYQVASYIPDRDSSDFQILECYGS